MGVEPSRRRACWLRERNRILALPVLVLVLLSTSGCNVGALLSRQTVSLAASDLGSEPRLLVSWEAPSLPGMRGAGSSDGGQNGIVEELHVLGDGGVVVLARNGVRFLDSAGRLERTVKFAHTYLWTALFRAADGIWVAGLHGAPAERELHAFPLGERAARAVWECKRCFRLAAADFDGNGHDSIVALNPQEYEDDSPWWVQPPPFRTAFWIVDPSSSNKQLVVSDNHAARIRTLDLEGDGREEVILYPYPAINASRYPFQHMSVLRSNGSHAPLWVTEWRERMKWRLPPLDRVGYVPVRPGPEARFAKISMYSQHLQLADAQGRPMSSHRLPGDVTVHQVVGWHEIGDATIIVLDRANPYGFPYADGASLVLELTRAGELREIARHTAYVTGTAVTPDGRLLAAEHRWDPTNGRIVFVRDYGPMVRDSTQCAFR